MVNTYIDMIFEGDKFSPSKLMALTSLSLKSLAEYGEISNKGRYKGQPSPYGLARLTTEGVTEEEMFSCLEKYMDTLLKNNRQALKTSGVEEIIIDIESPSNKEISIEPSILQKASTLNARIDFHLADEKSNGNGNKHDELVKAFVTETKVSKSIAERIIKQYKKSSKGKRVSSGNE